MASSTSVIIVEPREVLRRGLEAMLASLPRVDRCDCRSAPDEIDVPAEPASEPQLFDVAIASVDVHAAMSSASGGPLPARHSLALIESSTTEDLEAAVQTPVDGYLLIAETTAAELQAALDAVLEGQRVVPDVLSAHMLQRARQPYSYFASCASRLSPREREVLDLVLAGLSNKEIARRLGISLHAAKRAVSRVLAKFDVPSRSYLISQMLQDGLANPGRSRLRTPDDDLGSRRR